MKILVVPLMKFSRNPSSWNFIWPGKCQTMTRGRQFFVRIIAAKGEILKEESWKDV